LTAKANDRLAAVDWGVAARPLPGAAVSGDLHMVKPFNGGMLVAVVDGLGKETQAATAARTATTILGKYASQPLASLVERCHRSLMMTRGAVMSLASLDLRAGAMNWLGVGNVEGILVRGDPGEIPSVERLSLHGGVVGYQLPRLRSRRLSLRAGDVLAFATDGVSCDFMGMLRDHADAPAGETARRILARHFRGNDDGLVLVLRYLGGQS
jgi:negative regulator of sigma-B (phosphoserine phosphatase)